MKWILDPEEDGLDSTLAREELSRHDEIWGTGGEYIRQELLEALAEKSGIDIPITKAIPVGRVSEDIMAGLLHQATCEDGRYVYHDYWGCWPNGPAWGSPKFISYAKWAMETELKQETSDLAEMICKGKISDGHDDYHRDFAGDPVEYHEICEEIYEEEYDEEMNDYLGPSW